MPINWILGHKSQHEEQADLISGLSLEKFLSFGCFDSCYVLFWG